MSDKYLLVVVIINWKRLFYHYITKNRNTKEEITKFSVEEIIHTVLGQHVIWVSGRVNSPCAKWEGKENRMSHVSYTYKMLAPPCITQVN